MGVASLTVTAIQVRNGDISTSQGVGDSAFGITSMIGWQGEIISAPYFGIKALYENNKMPLMPNPNKRSMYPDEIFGNRSIGESLQLLKKYSWGGVFDD